MSYYSLYVGIIRALEARELRDVEIAAEYGVSAKTVQRIKAWLRQEAKKAGTDGASPASEVGR